jgi:hypothetical protein
MALGTKRKTPTTRGKGRTGTGTTARGQGKNMQASGRGSRTNQNQNLTGANTNITPQMIGTFQQWLRFGQKNGLINKFYGSTTHQNELQKYQSNKPAGLITGRGNQQRLAANA